MATDLDLAARLGAADHGLVVVAVARPDGSVHASVVNAGILEDPTSGQRCVGLVARGDAKKLEHMRRGGRATVVFRSGWEWASVEGPVRIVGPDDEVPGFDASRLPGLLRDIFRAAGGTHDDWEEFDRVMAEERRTAILVDPHRITGTHR